ncbi:MAG TPA: DUF2461 domain-containing protein [Candidatus Limnocylindrales bacterium]|nr:DUF2461 domain-containing protein [Candidatus Limnocylindrales bacterium]
MAVATPTQAFTGFKPDAIQFLVDLAANNDRSWFQPRKAEYEQLLKVPLEQMIAALAERLRERGVPLLADPARSPFRIYRDVRFSKDKSPYKTHLGASFPWVGDVPSADVDGRSHTPMVHSSGGYFHLQPGEIYVGGGIWHPDKPWIEAYRRRVADDPDEIRGLLAEKRFKSTFGKLSDDGHSLQRVPPGYAADHPAADLLKMKDVVFGRRLSDAEAESASLPDLLADTYAAAMPMFRYLASIG